MKALLRMSLLLMTVVVTLALAEAHGGEKKDKDKDKKPMDVVVNDSLTKGDLKDKARAQSYCKPYVFEMQEGKSYQIDMVSAAFDSYLRLENPQGEQVAADDDSGGFPHARIIYRAAKKGDFTIICTTFGGGSTGKFTLTVKEVAGN